MKRLTILLVAGMLLVIGASSAQARPPRLHYYEAYSAAQKGVKDSYFATDWASDYGATNCYRLDRIRFSCSGFISGDLGTFECTYDYSSCWTIEHYCDVTVRVRSGNYVNWYNNYLSNCDSYQQVF